jgi:hypothetical protein
MNLATAAKLAFPKGKWWAEAPTGMWYGGNLGKDLFVRVVDERKRQMGGPFLIEVQLSDPDLDPIEAFPFVYQEKISAKSESELAQNMRSVVTNAMSAWSTWRRSHENSVSAAVLECR